MANIPIHKTATVASSAKIDDTGNKVLYKVVVAAHTANAKVIFYDSVDTSGTILLTISALANKPKEVDLSEIGGLMFTTAMYCAISGLAATAYLWYD